MDDEPVERYEAVVVTMIGGPMDGQPLPLPAGIEGACLLLALPGDRWVAYELANDEAGDRTSRMQFTGEAEPPGST